MITQMSQPFTVHLLPAHLQPSELTGAVAVVIDLLRASTTITTALSAGARQVLPCGDVESARHRAKDLPAENVLLGGERGGVLIDGFDLDNSPPAYSPELVSGKTIVFTTTNGTAAIERVAAAARVLIGCFANLNALLSVLIRDGRPVRLVCAGTAGEISLEDVLCAGAIATGLWQSLGKPEVADDQTVLAMTLYQAAAENRETYLHMLRNSRGGRNLQRLGLGSDILFAARWDQTTVVPEYDQTTAALHVPVERQPEPETHLNPLSID